MPLSVAIVGMGNIGNLHATCYQNDPLAKIVAVCDIIKEKADAAAAKYGCPAFYTVRDMLAAGIHIDCASMCTAGKENGGVLLHAKFFQQTEQLPDIMVEAGHHGCVGPLSRTPTGTFGVLAKVIDFKLTVRQGDSVKEEEGLLAVPSDPRQHVGLD